MRGEGSFFFCRGGYAGAGKQRVLGLASRGLASSITNEWGRAGKQDLVKKEGSFSRRRVCN